MKCKYAKMNYEEVGKVERYIPDIYSKSIYDIDYENLISRGIKCVLFDLDNTLLPPRINEVSKKLSDFIKQVKKENLHFIIYSNSSKKRVSRVAEKLNLEYMYWVRKPFRGKFDKIVKRYEYNQSEIAVVGDQLLTDVLFGNKVGITTILVNPLSINDKFFTKFNRRREAKIYKKLYKNNLFTKGKYYE